MNDHEVFGWESFLALIGTLIRYTAALISIIPAFLSGTTSDVCTYIILYFAGNSDLKYAMQKPGEARLFVIGWYVTTNVQTYIKIFSMKQESNMFSRSLSFVQLLQNGTWAHLHCPTGPCYLWTWMARTLCFFIFMRLAATRPNYCFLPVVCITCAREFISIMYEKHL